MAAIIDCKPICVLKHEVDVLEIQKAIEFELVKLTGLVNVANNLKPHQIVFTAQTIIENYPAESLEDFILVFRRGAMGYYGSIFHQLDTSTILKWVAAHIDEKCNHLENQTKIKQKEIANEVDYEAFKKRIALKAKEQAETESRKRENQIRKFVDRAEAVKYQTSEEDAVRKKRHLEYIRANYDPRTGKPLSTWVSESDWTN